MNSQKRLTPVHYATTLGAGAFAILATAGGATRAHADASMILPQNMKQLNADMPNATYRFAGSNEPGQIFFLDEPINLNFVFSKGTDSGPVNDFGIEIQEISTRDPEKRIADVYTDTAGNAPLIGLEGKPIQLPIKVSFDEKPETAFTLNNVPVPAHFGTYAVVLTRGKTRQFLATLARVPHPRPYGTVDNVPVFGEGGFIGGPDMAAHAKIYSHIGVRGWRSELSWAEDKDGTRHWDNYDTLFKAAKDAGCQIMTTLGGSPPWPRPFGDPTPAAGWTASSGGYGGSGDWVVAPEYYERYGKWISSFVQRYGSKGTGALWGIENYNEPWEGGGISGWARDMLQYRALQKTIGTATRSVDPSIKLLAACSVMNTEDKLYPDGSNEMDKYVDIFTDHYVPPAMCYGPLVAAAHNKQSMETETWFVNSEYLLPQGVAQFMAAGQKHISPWHPRVLFDDVPGSPGVIVPTPVIAATAALNYMATGKPFTRMVFHKHLPFVFQFGADNDRDALLVMFGQLLPIGGDNPKELLWAQVNSSAGGTMTIDNHDHLLQFFDLAGNPEYVGQASVKLPMSIFPAYITSKRGPVMAAARLRMARIEGKRPVEIIPRDFSSSLASDNPVLNVDLHNCMNRAIVGSLAVVAPAGLTLKGAAQQAIALAAGETKTLVFPLLPLTAAALGGEALNSYPFAFHFTSDSGAADYAENMNMAIAPRGTKTIDGNLDDWANVPSVRVVGRADKIDPTELLRRPWLEAAQNPAVVAGELKMAWDDDNLYIAARVSDTTPETSPITMATRDENSYFHSAADDKISPYKEFIEDYRKRSGNAAASFAQVPYVYRRSPEAGIPFRRDRIQFGFDVTPGWHDLTPDTDRVPQGFHAYPDTDYEYSLYPTETGAELWRQLAPGVPRIHDWPHQPRGARTTGLVPGARYVVKREGSIYTYEASIPRSELATFPLKTGTSFGFMWKVGNSLGASPEYGGDKAATKMNGLTLHPYWERTPDAGIRWTLVN